MISEKMKAFSICDNCSKSKECEFEPSVRKVIQEFMNTPLHIHFPSCEVYEYYFSRMMKNIEKEPIENYKE